MKFLHLRRGVAEKVFGARVPARDRAVEASADDGIFGIFHDGGEPGPGLFSFVLCPVKTRALETGDVIDVGGATIVFDDGKQEAK